MVIIKLRVVVLLKIVVLLKFVVPLRVVITVSRLIVLDRMFDYNSRMVGLTHCVHQDFPPLTVVLVLVSAQDGHLLLGKNPELGRGQAGSLCLQWLVVGLIHEDLAAAPH